MGAGNRSGIETLVERTTRFLILLPFPDGIATTEGVRHAITSALESVPQPLRRTLTWDQGKELAMHQQITAVTGTGVFFCDAHSPWQRGSNENMNGLLRDYFPKGTDLSVHTAEDIARVAAEVNDRPRKTLELGAPSRAVHRRGRGRLTGPKRAAHARGSTPARPSGLASVEPRARQLPAWRLGRSRDQPSREKGARSPARHAGRSTIPCRHPMGLRSQRSPVATLTGFPTIAPGPVQAITSIRRCHWPSTCLRGRGQVGRSATAR